MPKSKTKGKETEPTQEAQKPIEILEKAKALSSQIKDVETKVKAKVDRSRSAKKAAQTRAKQKAKAKAKTKAKSKVVRRQCNMCDRCCPVASHRVPGTRHSCGK